jgi:NAD(P)-dependent dehydrogenase (short-subunit alcohol dehydrogenase family)
MKRNVLITGASGNLGQACVQKFLDEGYHVLTTVTPGKSLGFTADHSAVKTYEADLTNEDSAENLIHRIIKEYSTIDAALLLVGGFAMGNISNTNSAALKKMLSLNFDTAYFVARPVFQQMINQSDGGKIILVGSRPALQPKDGKGALAYTLSKSLIFTLAELLNAEGAAKNVTTSVIVPSTIDTPENRKAMPHADFSSWVNPNEIAEAMAFLCSEKNHALRDTVLKLYGNA